MKKAEEEETKKERKKDKKKERKTYYKRNERRDSKKYVCVLRPHKQAVHLLTSCWAIGHLYNTIPPLAYVEYSTASIQGALRSLPMSCQMRDFVCERVAFIPDDWLTKSEVVGMYLHATNYC